MLHGLSLAIANRLQRNSSNITNMTLNDTINTFCIAYVLCYISISCTVVHCIFPTVHGE